MDIIMKPVVKVLELSIKKRIKECQKTGMTDEEIFTEIVRRIEKNPELPAKLAQMGITIDVYEDVIRRCLNEKR
jgi:hypothetical protein